jgi:hypothetical protein
MSIWEHAETFAGLPVKDYDPETGLTDPENTACRLSLSYEAAEGGETMAGILARFLEDPAATRVASLVIGAWDFLFGEGNSSATVVEALVAARRDPRVSAGPIPR